MTDDAALARELTAVLRAMETLQADHRARMRMLAEIEQSGEVPAWTA